MAFIAANTELKALTGFTVDYSTTTQPTLTEAGYMIDMIDGEILSALAVCGIVSPATSGNLANLIKKFEAMGSAGLVFQRYGKNDNDYRLGDWYYTQYKDWINQVITDENYQQMISAIYSTGQTRIDAVNNQVTDGTVLESDVTYINEGFTV